ncbi:MAG TPA: protein kinase [Terriglobales bacterium]|nr:protein kinase [Terriglobales bacterium]
MTCPKCGASNPGLATRCSQCDSELPRAHSDSTWGGGRDSSPSPAPVSAYAGGANRSSIGATSGGGGGNFPTAAGVGRARIRPESEVDFGPRYRVEKLLGQGGMGSVYKAYDLDLNRTVALKLVRPELMAQPESLQRFKQELLLASKISHKNILRIHDLGDVAGTKFISMAYVDGSDLHHVLKAQGKLSMERTLDIAKQLCSALEAAHGEGVVHRDMKPQNVMLDKDDHVYVSDFGLAKSIESEGGMTMTGELLGTPRYMAPEQIECRPVDGRTDLYALGLIMYEMLTGDVPFQAESTFQLMYKRANETPPAPKQVNPDIPDWLNQVVMKCLERDPAKRYQTAREILGDLELQQSPSGFPPSMSIRLPQMALNVPMEKRTLIGLIVAIVLVSSGIALIGYRMVRRTSAAQVAVVPERRVAVLPIKVLGDEGELGYISTGITEALTAKLSQLKELNVASTAAIQRVNLNDSVPKIAKNLGVKYVIQGSLQGSGENILVLLNVLDDKGNPVGKALQPFSGKKQDLLTLEDDMFNALQPGLSSSAQPVVAFRPTENMNAYELYLKGRNTFLRGELDPKNVQAAIGYYEQATAADPNFALAWAGMADAYLRVYKSSKDSAAAQKALAAAQAANRIQGADSIPEVQYTLGSVLNATGKTAEAIAVLQSALKLAPNSDEAYRRLGDTYRAAGKKDDAIAAYKKAIELNPYFWFNYNVLGTTYYRFGLYEQALDAFKKVTELNPDNAMAYANLGAIYFTQDQWNESVPMFEKSITLKPAPDAYSNLGTLYFYLHNYEKAVENYKKAVDLSPKDQFYTGNLASGYWWAGDHAQAEKTFDQAISLGSKQLQVNPRDAGVMGSMALYYAQKGDTRNGQSMIRRAREIDPSNSDLAYDDAVISYLAGQKAQSVSALQDAVKKGYSLKIAKADPWLNKAFEEPEFQALVASASKSK